VSIHHRACHLCEAICGLIIETDGEDIVSIKGDPDDPLSRGHICPKAVALRDIHEDPDRLRGPVRKVIDADGSVHWENISWDEALDATAKQLVDTREQHGVDAVGVYMGNPTVHNYGMMTHQNALFQHFRTKNRFSATSVDQLPHHLSALWLYGHKSLFPIADIDRSQYMLMLGANPIASNGSIWTVPDVKKRIKALTQRGKLVVIDPRRTETAALANEHHFITPGSDVLFLLAVINTLFAEELANPNHLAAFTVGLNEVGAACSRFTPEFAATHCGIDADTIRRLTRELATAEAGICYGRMGVSVQEFGALCQWLIQIINIATGNLDKPGGLLFSSPALDTIASSSPGGFNRHRSRVRELPEFDRELPAACLAEEITTPGPGQIRALFTGAGNPVLSTPNGGQLERALTTLDFMVSLDPYINETTCHADIILPPTSPLEHDHYDMAFHGIAVRNTSRFNLPVFDKPQQALHDWEIFTELGNRVSVLSGGEAQAPVPPDQIVDLGLQMGPYGKQHKPEVALSLDTLREHPSGLDLGPLQPQLPARLQNPTKQLNCATPEPLADLERVWQRFQAPAEHDLQLIGRRHVRDNNSWMHNYHRLVKGPDRCTLMMHPRDMAARNIRDGATVELRSRIGAVTVTAIASEDIMPGVVSLPHGYGHHRTNSELTLAAKHPGVSCNDVTDHEYIDMLSGNAAVNGVPVTVTSRPED
jgi:anaerobic selenocysteine-containing dehydrogenase